MPASGLPIAARLMKLLGVSESIECDLDFIVDRTLKGSCQWLMRRQTFQDWVAANSNSSGFLWLTGGPGVGKSTLASFIISSFKRGLFGGICHYHFFVAGHQTKRTLSYLLRSVALQAALSDDAFCSRLLEVHENAGVILSQQNATTIWEKIFEGIFFR